MQFNPILAAAVLRLGTFVNLGFASNVCATTTALEGYVRDYHACIAEKAQAFEINGDTPDTVATAALAACTNFRQRIEDHVDLCGGANGESGAQVMQDAAQEYRDFAIQAVLDFRAKRQADESKLGLPR